MEKWDLNVCEACCKASSVRMILRFLTLDSKTAGVTKATAIKPLPPGGSDIATNIKSSQFLGLLIEVTW